VRFPLFAKKKAVIGSFAACGKAFHFTGVFL
jgi:hypothetical protein